jgi:Flp pilus assembly protein TadD
MLLSMMDRDEESLVAFRRADAEGAPGNTAVINEAAELLVLEDYALALETFERALTRAADTEQRFDALSGRGRALHRLHRYEDAVEAYRTALALECKSARNDWLIWQRLGEAYDALQRPRAALTAYRTGLMRDTRSDKSVDLVLGVSSALLALKEHDEAVAFLERQTKRAKPDARIDYNLGLAYLGRNDMEGARQALRRASWTSAGWRDSLVRLLVREELELGNADDRRRPVRGVGGDDRGPADPAGHGGFGRLEDSCGVGRWRPGAVPAAEPPQRVARRRRPEAAGGAVVVIRARPGSRLVEGTSDSRGVDGARRCLDRFTPMIDRSQGTPP